MKFFLLFKNLSDWVDSPIPVVYWSEFVAYLSNGVTRARRARAAVLAEREGEDCGLE